MVVFTVAGKEFVWFGWTIETNQPTFVAFMSRVLGGIGDPYCGDCPEPHNAGVTGAELAKRPTQTPG